MLIYGRDVPSFEHRVKNEQPRGAFALTAVWPAGGQQGLQYLGNLD
ncbi:hypothetical protein C171_00200 [Pseudomonas phage YMC11/06/C171_PPU_BP]|uniref:Uncharacterized protein n=1 Tax=Pseudomonas phage YMC11/06/C171_PPU_BP TaxID=1777063 RepID=A0A127KNI9_9CAUD|nr:hypothetical protein BH776_gp20 [Pseudomonas phage YMC11/06/C171_PPU_BP]AMO43644.1 hypothetical protein C171_00200 [Pseudomonas phage YMC11/06/C171_PPU_BP]